MDDKQIISRKAEELVNLASQFSKQFLDDEYSSLCVKMITKLSKKRQVPFLNGKIEIWAAAIIYALGQINFLFDKSFKPCVSADEICDFSGLKKSTVSQKAKSIRDMLKLNYFDAEFSTKQNQDENPMNDLVEINGFIVPIGSLPDDIREQIRRERK